MVSENKNHTQAFRRAAPSLNTTPTSPHGSQRASGIAKTSYNWFVVMDGCTYVDLKGVVYLTKDRHGYINKLVGVLHIQFIVGFDIASVMGVG